MMSSPDIQAKESISSAADKTREVYHTLDGVTEKIAILERFIARRFDEISMEINATAQQVDMVETGIIGRFSEVLEIISAISYHGTGDSAANTGVELEAVITDTEQAANTILDAADRISNYLDEEQNWSGSGQEGMRNKIRNDIQEILMACTFQDLTGQRIRNTLNNLHEIESRLSSTFERLGIEVKVDEKSLEEKVQRASSQEEIDALLKGYEAAKKMADLEKKNDDSKSSQSDIDSMF